MRGDEEVWSPYLSHSTSTVGGKVAATQYSIAIDIQTIPGAFQYLTIT